MISKDNIFSLLNKRLVEIKDRFSVSKIGLFGSFARSEETVSSDIDVLVEFEHATFDNYMDLKFFLEDLFQQKVDLVLADSLKPRLKPYIEKEVVYAQGL